MSAGGSPREREREREDREFSAELERRLETIESPDYRDPARRELPAVDVLVFTLAAVVVIVLMHLWGF